MTKQSGLKNPLKVCGMMLARIATICAVIVGLSACQTMETLDKQLHVAGASMQSGLKGALFDENQEPEKTTPGSRSTSVSNSLNGANQQESASILGATGASKPASVNEDDISENVDVNNRIVRRYQAALILMLEAQGLFQEALDIDTDKQKSDGVAEMLGGGVVEKSELERATALTEENNALIREKLEAGVELDEKGREKYASALPVYALGTLNSYLIVPEILAYVSEVQSTISQISGNPLMALRLVSLAQGAASGLYVASELPTLVGKWYDNTSTLITFVQENDVDVSEAEGAMEQVEL